VKYGFDFVGREIMEVYMGSVHMDVELWLVSKLKVIQDRPDRRQRLAGVGLHLNVNIVSRKSPCMIAA